MSDLPESKSRSPEGRFTHGNPGGPGRPRKVVKAAADALDARVSEAADELFDLALAQARDGNGAMVKMLLDRFWPADRGRPLEIGAPEIKHPRDLLTAMAGITNATLAGDATAKEGLAAAKVLTAHFQAIMDVDLEAKMTEMVEWQRKQAAKK